EYPKEVLDGQKTCNYSRSRYNNKGNVKNITWEEIKSGDLPKCHAIIGLQGQNIMDFTKRWSESFQNKLWESRVNTTRLLKNAINKSKCTKLFVSSSALSFYPPHPSKIYDETFIPDIFDQNFKQFPKGEEVLFLTKLCQEWERAAIDDPSQIKIPHNDLRTIIIRTGLVLGKDGFMMKKMLPAFKFYLGNKAIGSGEQWMSWIHISDIVGIMLKCVIDMHPDNNLNIIRKKSDTDLKVGYSSASDAAFAKPSDSNSSEYILKSKPKNKSNLRSTELYEKNETSTVNFEERKPNTHLDHATSNTIDTNLLIFNGTSPNPSKNRDFHATLANVLHKPLWFPPIPESILSLMLGPVMAQLLTKGQKVIPRNTIDILKYQFKYPKLRQAFEEMCHSEK
ncbi:unnamed protein product, partial [Gordionus sp. m RMFG-2023]